MKNSKEKPLTEDVLNQESESKYSQEELLLNVEALFGVKREVLLAALKDDQQEEYTVAEAQALIKAFMKRRVI